MRKAKVIIATTAAALLPSPAFTQQPSQGGASIPDFSGLWSQPLWPGFQPPLSGPGPVLNKSRLRQFLDADGRPLPAAAAPLVSNPSKLVGDYTNPILKPWAAEIVKQNGELELNGVGALTGIEASPESKLRCSARIARRDRSLDLNGTHRGAAA